MTKVFFTYVWGPPGNPAWPLTFATKAARTHARKVLTEGDLVFTVCTKGEPTAPENFERVSGVFQVYYRILSLISISTFSRSNIDKPPIWDIPAASFQITFLFPDS